MTPAEQCAAWIATQTRFQTPVEKYLGAWEWGVTVAHWYYDNRPSDNRCTAAFGGVDCSGGTTFALNIAGRQTACASSFDFARDCYNTPRPQWMTDHYGPGQGTFITPEQARDTPGAWGIHGTNWGMAPDMSGDGHIKTSLGHDNRSVEAMGHAAGVGYSTFLDGFVAFFAIPPRLDGFFVVSPPKPVVTEEIMWVPGPHAVPAGASPGPAAGWFPDAPNKVQLVSGQSIKGDAPAPGGTRVWYPPFAPGHVGVGIYRYGESMLHPLGTGIVARDDHNESHIGLWS